MTIPGNIVPLLMSEEAGAGGYQIERSLRFNSSDSAYLSRTPASAGNRKTWTWAGWVKGVVTSENPHLFTCTTGATDATYFRLWFVSDSIRVSNYNNNLRQTAAVYRDPSAWYHIVLAVDTTQATAANRIKLYVNGSEVTAFSSSVNPNQNDDLGINQAAAHSIGATSAGTATLSGYLADVHFIDGQALDPTSFTETDATTGQLIPKAYSGSFGTNGFWLKFSDNSAATATTLGKDYSGNNNNWSPSNLSVTAGAGNDSLTDSPTSYGTDTSVGGEVRGNYATLNPLIYGGSISAPTNGNLDISSGSSYGTIYATIGANSGKWYWEFTNTSTGSNGSCVGIAAAGATLSSDAGAYSKGYIYCSGALKANNNSYGSYGASWNTSGDIIGVAFDSDNGTLTFYKNGSSQGQAYSGIASTTEYYFPVFADASGSASGGGSFNFGQRPFAYTAPSGFKALCDTNLPAPVVAKSSDYFQTVLYTGNGSTQTVSGLSFSPDLVWLKGRSVGYSHQLYDQVRGAGKLLGSNTTNAESTVTDNLTAFTSSGFTLGNDAGTNQSSATYVAWAFDAGSNTVSNTAGSITSQVRANASAGFSIVTYTGNGATTTQTIGHGLNVSLGMVIVKARDSGSNDMGWGVSHASVTAPNYLYLNSTDAAGDAGPGQGRPSVGSGSTFSILAGNAPGTNNFNANGIKYVAYCFSPVAGYSSFGVVTATGTSDGGFAYTGFRPRFLLYKNASSTGNWGIFDTARDPGNVCDNLLLPSSSSAEFASAEFDLLSNGIKLRYPYTNGHQFVFAAFAESPFQYARAR